MYKMRALRDFQSIRLGNIVKGQSFKANKLEAEAFGSHKLALLLDDNDRVVFVEKPVEEQPHALDVPVEEEPRVKRRYTRRSQNAPEGDAES